ncbi:cysteine hydrolase family protein [Bacillus carboniphilus]|uniref:Cysteine hydrolase family protein n=1 Tax=Bacillus carboniphilus TaxID=86663 RepID=A0ABY9JV52_9BACI|nr:cysteine hydrolase family protein [Bacillus carboniphilus]WLR43270.1 cysteine hydrolase family protein [Bacillus carboniphilus]
MVDRPVLVVVDVQKGFDDPRWGKRNGLEAEENMISLMEHWRFEKLPIIHIQHSSKDKHSPLYHGGWGYPFKDGFEPREGEYHIIKRVNSAFIETSLDQVLKENHLNTLVIIGFTVPHCISTTARMAGNLGYQTFIVEDATVSFERKAINDEYFSPEQVHLMELSILHNEFANIISTHSALMLGKSYSF